MAHSHSFTAWKKNNPKYSLKNYILYIQKAGSVLSAYDNIFSCQYFFQFYGQATK